MAQIPEKYSDLDFTPPKAAQKNAKKALRWKEEHGDEVDGGTRVGWTRANQLAKGKELSPDIVDRMAQFNRHRSNSEIADEYRGEPWRDNGYIAWLIWGGDEGVDWAIRLADAMDKRDKESQNESIQNFRKIIRSEVREFLRSPSNDYDKNTSKKLKSYDSRNSKIIFYEDEDEKIFMKIINKVSGNVSDKIYIDNVDKFTKTVNNVNIIT